VRGLGEKRSTVTRKPVVSFKESKEGGGDLARQKKKGGGGNIEIALERPKGLRGSFKKLGELERGNNLSIQSLFVARHRS